MKAARALLTQNTLYRNYFMSRLISVFGDAIAQVALVLYVFHRFQNGMAVGILLFVQVVPRMLGPLTGTLADRVEQKQLLILCELAQAIVFLVIACAHPSFDALVFLICVSTILSTLFMPAGRSALATFISKTDLMTANVLLRTSFQVSRMLGTAVSGLLVTGFGAEAALVVDAASLVCSALFLSRLPRINPVYGGERKPTSFFTDVKEGILYISGHKVIRTLTVVMAIYVGFAAADNVALVFLAHHDLHVGDRGYSWLTTGYAVGMFLGSSSVIWLQKRFQPMTMLFLGIGLFGTGTLLTGFVNSIGIAIALQCVAAIGNSFESIATDTVVQQVVPQHMLGRVFGSLYSSMEGSSSLAFAAGGTLLEWMSARAVFLLSGSGVLLAAVCSYHPIRKSSPDSQTLCSEST